MYTRLPVWAPSPVADPLFREVPKAVTDGGDRRDRRRLRHSSPSTAPRAASTASSCSAATRRSCAASSPPPPTGAPTTTAAARRTGPGCCCEIVAAVRGVIGNRLALGVRLCGDELIDGGTTIDEAVEVARMVEATGQVDYINTSIGVATATLFMIEASMHIPPGYALFIPSAHPQGGRAAGRRRRPVQGSVAGGTGARRGALRPRRRRARPDRRRRLRGQGAGRRDRGDPPVPVVQPGVRRPDGPQPLAGLHREPADRPRSRVLSVRIGRDRPAVGQDGGASSSSGPGPAGCRRRSPRRATGTA